MAFILLANMCSGLGKAVLIDSDFLNDVILLPSVLTHQDCNGRVLVTPAITSDQQLLAYHDARHCADIKLGAAKRNPQQVADLAFLWRADSQLAANGDAGCKAQLICLN